jgi:hypothetical protein
VSFLCKACGNQRAGSPAEGLEVCEPCRPTQAGRAALLLRHFQKIDVDDVLALETVLDDASNLPPDGYNDGSLTENRFIKFQLLARAARDFNEAVDNAALATFERES